MSSAYLFLRTDETSPGDATQKVLRAAFGWGKERFQWCPVVDENLVGPSTTSSLIFRVDGFDAYDAMRRELAPLIEPFERDLDISIVRAADSLQLVPSELETSYFWRETNSPNMIPRLESGVRLVHLPSGKTASCRESVRREENFRTALAILKALVATEAND